MSTYWQQVAIEDLKSYNYRKQSLDGMGEEVAALKSAATSISAIRIDSAPSASQSTCRDDVIVNNIVRRDELMQTMLQTSVRCSRIENALRELDSKERMILTALFVAPQKGAVEYLCRELNYDKATVYRYRTKALRNFTLLMYGRAES